jgi:hypothetical protein
MNYLILGIIIGAVAVALVRAAGLPIEVLL